MNNGNLKTIPLEPIKIFYICKNYTNMKNQSKFIYFFLLFFPMTIFAQSKEDTSAWLNAYASDLLGYFNNGANEFSVTKEGLITKKTGSVNADGVIQLSENTSFNVKDLIISEAKCIPDGNNYMFMLQTNGNKIKIHNGTLVPKIEIFSLSSDITRCERVMKAIFILSKRMQDEKSQ